LKRTFDIILAIILLPISLVLIFIFAIFLVIELKEFPFFIQKRGITLNYKVFNLIKLKTIKSNVIENYNPARSKNILLKPNLAKFISPFAKWLRRSGLDELPQIFNIIKGDMSFVGPRPLMLSDLQEIKTNHKELYEMRKKIIAKPGLTGLWQIFCDHEEGVKNLIALDKIYDEVNNIFFDVKILFFTIPIVLTGSNTDSILQNKSRLIINLFNLSNTTRFKIYKKLTILNSKKKSNYVVEIPGDWWYDNITITSSSGEDEIKIKAEKRKYI